MGKKSRAKREKKEGEAPREAPVNAGRSGILGRGWFQIALIVVVGIVVYSNTISAPFQWDDRDFITNNPIIRDMGYFLDTSRASDHYVYMSLRNRYVGYLSFALNYKLHGLDVTGYHVVNIAIHIITALLVYLLALVTFRTPALRETGLSKSSRPIALFSALIFVAHPVQIEAVTYVFQRLASLAGLFYLLSVASYCMSRLSEGAKGRYGFYALCLLAAVLAMKTKENTFTLPAAILLYELVFFGGGLGSGGLGKRLLRLVPILLCFLIIPMTILGASTHEGRGIFEGVGAVTRGFENVTRAEYLFTQFRVVVTYLRLLVLPVNQNIDYMYQVSHSFLEPAVIASFIFLSVLFGAGAYLIARALRKGQGELGLIGFGVVWFFLTLSVESSVIPIPMMINEYRVYIPSMGFIIAATSGAYLLARRLAGPGAKATVAAAALLAVIVVALSGAAYARNSVWRTEIGLWEDVVKKTPSNTRGRINLGNHYKNAGLYGKAEGQYEAALELQPQNAEAHNNLGTVYWLRGMLGEAAERFETAIGIKPAYVDAHTNLGAVYWARNDLGRARENYEAAVRLDPYNSAAYSNLGLVYYSMGQYDKAIGHYRTSLRLKPEQAETHNNMASALFSKGMADEAVEHYRIAIELNPGYVEAHFNLGMLYFEKGDFKRSRQEMMIALKLKPGMAQAQEYIGKLPQK